MKKYLIKTLSLAAAALASFALAGNIQADDSTSAVNDTVGAIANEHQKDDAQDPTEVVSNETPSEESVATEESAASVTDESTGTTENLAATSENNNPGDSSNVNDGQRLSVTIERYLDGRLLDSETIEIGPYYAILHGFTEVSEWDYLTRSSDTKKYPFIDYVDYKQVAAGKKVYRFYAVSKSNNGGSTTEQPKSDDSNGGSTTSKKDVYRLYNASMKQYFYTKNWSEVTQLKARGWKYEGRSFKAAEVGKPVYRLYNPNRKTYAYTTNASERDNSVRRGWKYEGVAWYSAGDYKVYRLFDPKQKVHVYTSSESEVHTLKNRGWKYEGIAWYSQQ